MVRRIAREIARAAQEIKIKKGQVPEEGVHEARRAIKRARAGLRLVGRALGPEAKATKGEVAALGEVGRMLSDARDSTVIYESACQLAKSSKTKQEKAAGMMLVEALKKRRGSGRVDARTGARLRTKLRAAQARLMGWRLGKGEAKALEEAIRQTRSRLVSQMQEAIQVRSDDALHAWRKRAQDFRFQLDMLKDVVPKSGVAALKRARVLTGVLGTDHDLAVLADYIQKRKATGLGVAQGRVLMRRIAKERKGLLAKARKMGKGI
jgi:CHAD domain-containing protein